MDNDTLKSAFGINGRRLAKLTGQSETSVSRKLNALQGQKAGPREAGVLACFKIMTDDQRKAVDAEFDAIMDQLSDND